MRRSLVALAGAAGVLCVLVLSGSPAAVRPASAGLLPSPLPLPSLLPSLPPLPLPVPSPVASTVNQVVNPVVSALPLQPLHPSQSGQPASAADGGGAGAGVPASSAAASAPPYQPPPAEQAALPAEPQRVALEGQQAWVADWAPALDQADGGAAQVVGGGDGQFVWPIIFSGRPPITQRFGCTDVVGEPYSPDCATHRWHTGIDLADHMGAPVYAAEAGVAHVFPGTTGYGNYVLIVHGSGWSTLYAHLSRFTVTDGEVVRRGDPIGLIGSTGFSSGPHLHFETRFAGKPLDPCTSLGC